MSAIIGTVTSIAGNFSIRRANGSMSELLKGDEIHAGDIVSGLTDGAELNSLVVGMTDGIDIVMLSDDSQLFDASLLQEEFSENETVTDIGSVESMVENGDFIEEFEEDIDELDTEAGEEEILSSSTDTPMVNFAEIDNNGVDINAELRDVDKPEENDILDNNYEKNREVDAFNLDDTNSEISDMVPNMSELINSANLAAIAANNAARLANSAATIADLDPTAENLAEAERAQTTANAASIDVANAATLLEELIVDLNAAAVAAGRTVDTTDATRAVDDANAASLAASDAAIYSETTTDSEIEDMLESVSDLTDVLNMAAQNANLAADAVTSAVKEAQNNPTPENLEAVENAQEAINFAVANSQNAAIELDNAIDLLNTAADVTNETVDTTDALEAVKNAEDAISAAVAAAIAAEAKSDAEIAEMVDNVSDLTDAANLAAQNANSAAIQAQNAAVIADVNPIPENLAEAESAQATATQTVTAATNAATDLQNAINDLNAAASAANEIVDTTAATDAVDSANTASTNAATAADASEAVTDSEISDMVSNVSDLTDAANTAALTATDAATAADQAALTAQNNPTIENLTAAEDAQAAADSAAADATDAASTLEDAVADLNAAASAANEIVDTTAATDAVDSANTASTNAATAADASEAVTDSEISDMVSNVVSLTSVAEVAAQNANFTADEANEAVRLANENPTLENLDSAYNAQEVASTAAVRAADAAEVLENTVNDLNEMADAANETIDSEVLSAANNAVDSADNSADSANQSANINLNVSSVSDSDLSDNIINENVEDGTYTGVTLSAIDVDGEAVTYSIEDGVPFRVEEDGRVVVDGDNAIDFEANENFTFDVTATSADGTTSTQSVTIDVENINEAPIITDTQTISTTEDSLDGFSGYGDTWSGNVYSIITQEEMLNHLSISDSDSSSFSVSLANTDDGSSYHHGLQATDSTFSNPTANAYDEQVIQITQEFLNTYPQIDGQVGDFYFDNVAFDSLSEGESANISFGVVVSDGELTSEVKTVNIEVQGSNEIPVINITDTTATEDTAQIIANVSDIDGTIDSSSLSAENGTVTIAENGDITYTPDANYNGPDTVSISVTDNNGGTTTQAISVSVAGVNDSVTQVTDSDSTVNVIDENVADGTYTGVTLNAVDVDGEAVTYSVVDDVPFRVESDGRVVVDGDNAIDFEANENFTFDVTATSADGTISTQSVTIDVENINEGPVTTDDNLAEPDNSISFDGANDYIGIDVNVPESNYSVSITFSTESDNVGIYSVRSDVHSGANDRNIYLDNDGNLCARVWNNEVIKTDGIDFSDGKEHTVVHVLDGTNQILYVDGVQEAIGNKGTSDFDWDGRIEIGYCTDAGNDYFEGQISDVQVFDKALTATDVTTLHSGEGISDSTLVHYDFNGENPYADVSGNGHDATAYGNPTLIDSNESVAIEDTALTIESSELLANDTDIDGDTLSITAVEATADTHGTVSLDVDGNVVFTPDANYNGEASFSYTVSDGQGGEDSATVTVNVDSVNDAVSVVTDSDATANAIDENVADGSYTGVTLNAVDVDGEAITYSVSDGVPFSVNENGEVVTSGEIDFETNPSYTFDVTATSADGTSSTQSVTVNVNNVFEASHSDETIINGALDGSDSVDTYTFHHNGGSLTLDALTESGMRSGGGGYRGGRGGTSTEVYNDLDGSGSQEALDIILELKDTNGNTIAFNDDGYSAGYSDGSVNSLDSYINMSNLPAGDYIIDISSYASSSSGPYKISITGDIDNAKLEINGTSADDILNGTDADETINGGVGADIVDAGAGHDDIVFDATDTVDGGEGFDTLVFGTEDSNIDFSALADNSINNIEAINLGDGVQNITSLTTADVLDMTDTDNLLRIDGDSSDSVDLNTQGPDAEWTLGDFKTDAETGATYQEVTGVEDDVTVTLEISTDIQIDQN